MFFLSRLQVFIFLGYMGYTRAGFLRIQVVVTDYQRAWVALSEQLFEFTLICHTLLIHTKTD